MRFIVGDRSITKSCKRTVLLCGPQTSRLRLLLHCVDPSQPSLRYDGERSNLEAIGSNSLKLIGVERVPCGFLLTDPACANTRLYPQSRPLCLAPNTNC
jgi:hypothetical protein